MDFGALPPEINSGRMYAGPGSGSLVAAAAAWNGLAADLHSIAISYQSVISGLTSGPWLGPASISMAAAAAPYTAWLHTTAANAELAGSQVTAAAAAHAEAFAMHVPPPVVAANRALLMSLIATNFLGQNTAAIAATEAQYGEMWAQDAVAMYEYAGASAAATNLTQFAEAPLTTNAGGLLEEAGDDAEDAGNSAGTDARIALSQLASKSSDGKSATADPPASPPLDQLLSLYAKYIGPHVPLATAVAQSTNAITSVTTFSKSLAPAAAAAGKEAQALGSALGGVLGPAVAPGGITASGAGQAVTAGMSRAASVGALSVPPSWSASTPATSPLTSLRPTSITAPPATATGANGTPMAPFGPLAANGGGRAVPQYGFRPTVVARPPAAG